MQYASLLMHMILATPVLKASTAAVQNTSITLRWRTSNTPEIIYYNISYTAVISLRTERGDTVTYPVKKVMSATGSSYTFRLLNPSTTYTFTVTAYTKNGPGPSDTVIQSTDEGRTGNLLWIMTSLLIHFECRKSIIYASPLD